MKKIGIITHYYKRHNYGGNLQSYALVKLLNDMSYQSEQITFDFTIPLKTPPSFKERIKKFINYSFKEKANKIFLKFSKLRYEKKCLEGHLCRIKAVEKFNKNTIPHSEVIYTPFNIKEANFAYDCFITGSDQVWSSPINIPAFFLDFVDANKIKISYAASIARSDITIEEKKLIKKYLLDYNAISVREQADVKIISELTDLECPVTLDPTLLVEADHWNMMATDKVTDEKYIFTYFLGDYKISRNIVKKFSIQKKIKIITIPHLNGFKLSDIKFGDEQISNVTVEKFLSLIKHAEYIFTDSFHAGVFSHIFKKEFFIFNRNKDKMMTTRIYNLLDFLELPERFCDTKEKENIKYINSQREIDYTKKLPKFDELKKRSLEFLDKNLQNYK